MTLLHSQTCDPDHHDMAVDRELCDWLDVVPLWSERSADLAATRDRHPSTAERLR